MTLLYIYILIANYKLLAKVMIKIDKKKFKYMKKIKDISQNFAKNCNNLCTFVVIFCHLPNKLYK
jgi:hypothetical protein